MKRILSVFLIASAFVLVSCGATKTFLDDVRIDTLTDTITTALERETDLPYEYIKDESGLTEDYFKAPDYIDDSAVYYVRNVNNINEFGVYHVTDGRAHELASLLQNKYLRASFEQNREWYDSYIPEQTPKLRDAEVRVFGNYVVYAILDSHDRTVLFNTVERLLAK